MNEQQVRGRKKTSAIVLSVVLIAVLGVGATLAYLSMVTPETKNSFTFVGGKDISVTVDETFNPDDAKNLTPGAQVTKTVTATNTSTAEGMNAYVAMKVIFTNKATNAVMSDEDHARLMGLITLDGLNTTDFTATPVVGKNAEIIYIYNDVLAKDAVTPALFDSVTISSTMTNEDATWLADTLKGFDIDIKAAIVQESAFAQASDAYTELATLLNA